jgi:HAMP domain-containing protein
VLRYYAIATLIVLTVVVAVTAWQNRALIRLRIAPTNLSQSPKPGEPLGPAAAEQNAFRGDAPWALSALPECLQQTSESNGTLAYVRSKLPPGATEVAPGTQLTYADCTIFVGDGELFVRRGPDRLRVPPRVALYRADGGLALLRYEGERGKLLIYQPAQKR